MTQEERRTKKGPMDPREGGYASIYISGKIFSVVGRLSEAERRSRSNMAAVLIEEALLARGELAFKEPVAS